MIKVAVCHRETAFLRRVSNLYVYKSKRKKKKRVLYRARTTKISYQGIGGVAYYAIETLLRLLVNIRFEFNVDINKYQLIN